jgi:hypothetical protein
MNEVQDDSFACPHCRTPFTPANFPFNLQWDSGAMGPGSERATVRDSQCPACKRVISAGFFSTCAVCKRGLAKSASAGIEYGDGERPVHYGCLSKLIPPVQKVQARRYGQPKPSRRGIFGRLIS